MQEIQKQVEGLVPAIQAAEIVISRLATEILEREQELKKSPLYLEIQQLKNALAGVFGAAVAAIVAHFVMGSTGWGTLGASILGGVLGNQFLGNHEPTNALGYPSIY